MIQKKSYHKNRPIVGFEGDDMKKGEKRRIELLKIAYEMFITKGYENTSIDAIIEKAGIAKGTFYYHFQSKDQMLEEVIGMMIDEQVLRARGVLESDLPIPQRIVGIISSIRPEQNEQPIADVLHTPENLIMHEKVRTQIYEKVTPLLESVAIEGIDSGIFDCDMLPERIRIILMLASDLFDETGYTQNDIEVFIDVTEKILGAKKGTMGFVRQLIR